jgi:hypothetical protein
MKSLAAKVALAVGALVVVPLVAGLLVLRTDRGHDLLRRAVLAEARKSVPGLSVGALGGGLMRDLSLRNVELRDAQGRAAVHLDEVTVRYRLLRLLHHELAVDELRVHGVKIHAVREPDGSLNLAHLTAPSPEQTARPPSETSSAWTIAVAHARIDGVSATLEAPDAAPRALSLSAEGSVRLDARTLDARLASSLVGGLLPNGGVVSIAARVTGPRDALATHVEAAVGRGRATVDGTVGLPAAGARPVYELALDVVDLDPAALREGAPAGRVSLALRARGEGLPPAADARTHAELSVSPSEVAGVHILGGAARADAHGDAWELTSSELRVESAVRNARGHGALTFAAEGAAGKTVTFRGRASAETLRVQTLRVRALALDLEGTVATPAAASPRVTAKIAGHLGGLVVGEGRVGDATLALAVDGTPAAPNGTVSLVANDVVAARGAPVIDRANVKLTAAHGQLSVQASARGPRLRAAVSAHGLASAEAGDVTVEQLALDVTVPAYRQQLALMSSARVRYRTGGPDEELTLGRTVVKGAGARFTGQVTLQGELRPRATGRVPLAHAVLRLARASTGGLTPIDADVEANVTRTRGTVHVDAAMPSAGARVKLDADVPLEVPRRGAPRLASRGPVTLHLTTNKIQLQEIPVAQRALARQGVTGGTMTLELQSTGDLAHPEAHCAFDLRDVTYRNLAGLGRDSRLKTVPGLGGSVKVDARDGSVVADAQLLIRDTGVLGAHVVVPFELSRWLAGVEPASLPFRGTVTIPTLELASLANFTDGLAGVDGRLHGTIEVSGTLERPTGQADLAIDAAQVDKLKFKQVLVHAEARRGLVRGRLQLEELTGGRLDGKVSVERDHDDRLEGYLTGKDLDVSFLRVFSANLREVAGIAQLSATAKGTLAAPKIWATLSLGKGRLGLTGQPTFRDVQANVALQPGRLDLNRLEMSSGDGRLEGNGSATLGGPRGLTPQTAMFRAHAHRFLVAVAGSGGARLDGDLAFEAALRADVLEGKVNVPNASVWLPKTPSAGGGAKLQKVGQHADLHFVDATAQAAAARDLEKKRRAAAAAVRLALHATASPVYVRGKDLDVEVRSNVQIGTVPSGPHRGAVTLAGGIHIPRGRINIQGRRFDFDHGDVTFDGSWDVNPALDIKLTRQFPDALVVVELRGTPKKPKLHLSSEPAVYDQAQIVSLILTGQPGGQPSNGKSFDPTAVVATAVLSRLADQIAPELGLDVVRVEKQDVTNEEGLATGDSDTRVEVGKYISERIYLSYAHIFGAPETANQNEAHVEYRMTRRWMLETLFGDAGQGGLDALWTYRF